MEIHAQSNTAPRKKRSSVNVYTCTNPAATADISSVADRYLSTVQAAKILKSSLRRVRWLIETNAVSFAVVCGRYLLLKAEIMAIAERERQAATPTPTEAPENVNA